MISTREKGRRSAFRVALAVAVGMAAIASLLAFAHSAAAAEFVYHPCETTLHNGFWEREYPPYDVSVDCLAREIRFAANGSSFRAEPWVIARYSVPYGRDHTLRIASASMRLSGLLPAESGRIQGVRFCTSSTTCGPVLPENPTGAELEPADWTFTSAGGQIPTYAQRMEIVGRCDLELGCDTPTEMSIKDISLVFEDSTKPVMDWQDPHFYPGELDDGSWVSDARKVKFTGTDKGSGVAYSRLRLMPGGYQWTAYAPCSLLDVSYHTRFCPTDDYGPETLPDPKARPDLLPQGDTTLEIWSVDMAGNESAREVIPFHVDVTPPNRPQNLRLLGSSSNWTNQPVADIAWDPIVDPYGEIAQTRFNYDGTYEGFRTGDPQTLTGIPLAPDTVKTVAVYARDRAGNEGPASSITVGRDEFVFSPPALDAPEYIGRSHLADPAAISWQAPADVTASRSGLCGYSMSVDDSPDGQPPTQPSLGASASGAPAPGNQLDGAHYMHLRAVSCSGQAGESAHEPVVYDLTPPRAEHDGPASSWLSEGDALTIRGFDGQTAVRAMHFSVDGGTEHSVAGDSAQIELVDGVHQVVFQSEDMAGNRSPERAVAVGVDGSSPMAWIEPPDPNRPTLMRAFAVDDRAGLESARFVYRPFASNGAWAPFGESASPNPAAPQALTLSAEFPELLLPDGAYEIAVEAVDRVGRSSISSLATSGVPAIVNLPLRATPRMEFRIVSGRRKVTAAYVGFGARPFVVGRLTSPDGAPLSRVPVELAELRAWTGSRIRTGAATTDDDGRFRHRLKRGVWRNVIARYAGSERLRPVESAVEVKTRAKAILEVRPRRVVSSSPITFTMRIALGGAPINDLGRIADIQSRRPGGEWHGFIDKGSFNLVRDKHDPRFAKLRYRQPAPDFQIRRVLEFRLKVNRQDRWQYETGYSKPVTVTIVPRGGD